MKLNQSQIQAIARKVSAKRNQEYEEKKKAMQNDVHFQNDVQRVLDTITTVKTMLKTLTIPVEVSIRNCWCVSNDDLRGQVEHSLLEQRLPSNKSDVYSIQEEIVIATIDSNDLSSLAAKLGITL